MTPIDATTARELLEAMIAASSVLGGGMAYLSGFYASQAISQDKPPEFISHRINEGIGRGFRWLWPISIVALMIMVWT